MKFGKVLLLQIGLLLLCSTTVFGQIRLSGKVIDASTGETIIGAIVSIDNKGAATDIDGAFGINGITVGKQILKVEYLSFEKYETSLELNTDMVITVSMKPAKATQLGEVEVTSNRRTGTESSVLMELRGAAGVASGLSARQIGKSGDQDAAAAARRIPGVTLVDNRFVMVRGLQERYNAVLINGVLAPSLETDVRSFSFDLIPSHLLEKIIVQKSPLPNLQGDFAGGCIQVETKEIPDHTLDVRISTGLGYRNGTTGLNYLSGHSYKNDRFANGANDRGLSSSIPASLEGMSRSELASYGPYFNNPFELEQRKTPLDSRSSVGVGAIFKWRDLQFGSITSMNYSTTASHLVSELNNYNTYDLIQMKSDTSESYRDSVYTQSVRIGVLQNFSIRGKNFSISSKNIWLRSSTDETAVRNGTDWQNTNEKYGLQLRYMQRDILSSQLNGTANIIPNKGILTAGLGYNETQREEPDTRRILYQRDSTDPQAAMQAVVTPSAQPFYLGRLFMNLSEVSRIAHANYEHKIIDNENASFCKELKITVGHYHQFKGRYFGIRNLGYKSSTQFNWDLTRLPVNEILSPTNIYNHGGFLPAEDTKPTDSYFASNLLNSSFAMLTIGIQQWTLTGGIRHERNIQVLKTSDQLEKPLEQSDKIEALLPSASLSHRFAENWAFRATYGKSLNRPEFRELAPFAYYDFVQNLVSEGNPELQTPLLHNYDARIECYPSSSEMISVGFFYKNFVHPIELALDPTSTPWSYRPYNALSAYSKGIELDFRYSMKHIIDAPVIRNILLVGNACIVKSKVQITQDGDGASTRARAMMFQSPYVINGGLYYNNDSTGIGFAVMYNVTGPRLTMAGINGLPDVYEMPRHVLDIQLTLGSELITHGKLKQIQLKLGIQDALNQPYMLLQDANGTGGLVKGQDQLRQQYARGTYYTAAISYSFSRP